MKCFGLQAFRVRAERSYIIRRVPPGEQRTRGKNVFSSMMYSSYYYCAFDIWKIFVLLARNFESTKTPRESLLDACDCHLAHPTPSHTPSGASLNFEGCCCLWGAVAVHKWSANVQFWGLFSVSIFVPQISTNFNHCSASNSRCRPLLRTCRRPIWRESQALWMKHSWWPPAIWPPTICKARTSRRCKRSVLKMATMFLFR